jgi:hypothetical protein
MKILVILCLLIMNGCNFSNSETELAETAINLGCIRGATYMQRQYVPSMTRKQRQDVINWCQVNKKTNNV